MKKLSKLKLKEFHEMSDFEMKNVVGGYGDSYGTGDDRPVGKCSREKCSGSCYVSDSSEPHPKLQSGTCGWTNYPDVRCTCAAGYLG